MVGAKLGRMAPCSSTIFSSDCKNSNLGVQFLLLSVHINANGKLTNLILNKNVNVQRKKARMNECAGTFATGLRQIHCITNRGSQLPNQTKRVKNNHKPMEHDNNPNLNDRWNFPRSKNTKLLPALPLTSPSLTMNYIATTLGVNCTRRTTSPPVRCLRSIGPPHWSATPNHNIAANRLHLPPASCRGHVHFASGHRNVNAHGCARLVAAHSTHSNANRSLTTVEPVLASVLMFCRFVSQRIWDRQN